MRAYLRRVPRRVDVVFDVPDDSPYHRPTIDALDHAAAALGARVDVSVVRTDEIDERYLTRLRHPVVIGPGAPYAAPAAVDETIRSARERGLPLVGT